MLLQNILSNYDWSPYGIICPDAITAKIVHTFMREAVLDRHIYINKIIGFKIKSAATERAHAGTYIARHKQLAESYPEIMTMLLDKVFLSTTETEIKTMLSAGNNTTDKLEFLAGSDNSRVDVLASNPNVCRVLDKQCILQMKTVYDCGYRDMRLNSKKIGSEYFPCYTDFSLSDYVKVPPLIPGQTIVPIRYYNGMTIEKFKDILVKYLVTIQTGGIRKEEKEWLQNFMQ